MKKYHLNNEVFHKKLRFSKMHSLGNDFMVLDAVTQNVVFSPERIRQLADRHRGVGFDQLLLVEPPYEPQLDFHYRIFNADGSEVSQCGNGACSLARFVHIKGLTRRDKLYISTISCSLQLNILADRRVCVDMGQPCFEPEKIPFVASDFKKDYTLQLADQTVTFSVVSLGNPHCVILVKDSDTVAVDSLGAKIAHHKFFPKQTNVSFMQVINPQKIRLRVYERGVGETQACGSAACAAVASGIMQKLLSQSVSVELLGGTLEVYWQGSNNSIYLTSYAEHVYDGWLSYKTCSRYVHK